MKQSVCIKSPDGTTVLSATTVKELEIKLHQYCLSFGSVRTLRTLTDWRDHEWYDGHIWVDMLSREAANRLAGTLQGARIPDGILATVCFLDDVGVPRPDT